MGLDKVGRSYRGRCPHWRIYGTFCKCVRKPDRGVTWSIAWWSVTLSDWQVDLLLDQGLSAKFQKGGWTVVDRRLCTRILLLAGPSDPYSWRKTTSAGSCGKPCRPWNEMSGPPTWFSCESVHNRTDGRYQVHYFPAMLQLRISHQRVWILKFRWKVPTALFKVILWQFNL